jgi:competence protein ComFC
MPLLEKILSVVAPHQCLICQREGKLLCAWCEPDAFPPLPSRCYRCHALSNDFAVCDRCRRHSPLRQVWVRTAFEGVAKELAHGYKYERQSESLNPIVSTMAEAMPYLDDQTLLVPIPTATARKRQRGYDHALRLARHLAAQTKHMYIQPLARLNQTRQVGAGRQQRFLQLQNAFVVTKPKLVRGKRIILVDDIVTTGATLETVAQLFKAAGAKRVDAVVFAQKR